jgi:2-polyprenyl-3-methyl-5-hydroxy-6-metoxy-1,4-benzoquinol methylase
MCVACQIDTQKTEAFGQQIVQTLNHGALSIMISVAHRTRLFELMSTLGAATSHQIAESGGLQERYVRECLGALVTGGIIEYDPKVETYRLPPEHAAFLTRAGCPHNLAVLSQFLTVFGSVEDQLVDCFHKGGGVPYSAYPRFQEIMAEMSGQTVVFGLLEAILPLVPELTQRLDNGIRVLDIGCGSGRALNTMAERYSKSEFVGYDLSEDGIRAARAEAKAKGLTNITFKVQDVSVFEDTNEFDLVTAFDSIHDQIHPDKVLANIRRALRPTGTFLMQDIRASSQLENNLEHPLAPLLYTFSCTHCMTVSLAMGGAGLGTVWGEELAQTMLGDAGFTKVDIHTLPDDILNNFYVAA